MEEFLNDNNGSVEGYLKKRNGIEVKLKDNKNSAFQKEGITICQNGIMNYCSLYNHINDAIKRILLKDLHKIHLLFSRLIDLPISTELKVLKEIYHCNDYGNDDYNLLIDNNHILSTLYEPDIIKRIFFYGSVGSAKYNDNRETIAIYIRNNYNKVYIYTFNRDIIDLIDFLRIEIVYILERNRYLSEMYYENIMIKYLPDYINELDDDIPIIIPEEVDGRYEKLLKEQGCRQTIIRM